MNQDTALKILKSGKNVFLTGSAGAGKTYLLNKYIEYLRARNIPLAITASTGIAATHLGGQTIHSWSGLGIRDELFPEDLAKMAKKKPLRTRLEQVQVLIIDEVSMLSGRALQNINEILQYFKVSFAPFGGVQIVFSGDFFQLPPVSREPQTSAEKFAFMAPIWVQAELQICYLTCQYRQDDSPLLSLLNQMRSGEISDASGDLIMEKLVDSQKNSGEEFQTKLFTHNRDVERVNAEKLKTIKKDGQFFFAKDFGPKTTIDSMKKSILAPENLELKVGARVMFVKNSPEQGYYNGTLGTVIDFTLDPFPVIETLEGQEIVVKPVDWSFTDEWGKPVATYTQVPLRLAWAITIHKSQGMTLDEAEMDLTNVFEPGQGYVALSRVKYWGGLRLLGCGNQALLMDPLALKADKRFQEIAQVLEKETNLIEEEVLNNYFDQFVLKAGGIRLKI